jgi:hypothetical protein
MTPYSRFQAKMQLLEAHAPVARVFAEDRHTQGARWARLHHHANGCNYGLKSTVILPEMNLTILFGNAAEYLS